MTVDNWNQTELFFPNSQGNMEYGVECLVPRMREAVADVFGICVKDLRGSTRGRAQVALARQVAMYLSHVVLAINNRRIGDLFGRDRSTVTHACKLVEDRRDDPAFDQWQVFIPLAIEE